MSISSSLDQTRIQSGNALSFLNSVVLGREGSYHILGFEVVFKKYDSLSDCPMDPGFVSFCKSCSFVRLFRIITQDFAYMLSHEMGHALAYRAFMVCSPKIFIFTDVHAAWAEKNAEIRTILSLSDTKNSIALAAGPMVDMTFSACKLVAAVALRRYLSTPVALILGLGSLVTMIGTLSYAWSSASNRDGGDFGKIARISSNHLAIASIALVGQCALGVYLAYQFL
jgi:hypothetical protein